MYEQMIISMILNKKDLSLLKQYNLEDKHFLTCMEEVLFIRGHHKKYGVVPSVEVFIDRFREFEICNSDESMEYLSYKLREAFIYKDVVPVIKQMSELVREDSIKAIEFIKNEIDKIVTNNKIRTSSGIDIIRTSEDRLGVYLDRVNTEGMLGISTGIPMLDELTFGWMKEDLVVIFARTNKGKSWIILYFLVVAWSLGKKVLLYSGEMSSETVGFRLDTIYKHFSNNSLMSGDGGILEEYTNYIDELRTREGFVVVTPKDLGDKPRVSDLRELFIEHNADILGIDQLSLMRDERRGENKRVQYTNITEDLYLLSEELQKPILLVHQASRNGAKVDDDDTPVMEDLAESDGIAQNATRVLSMNVTGNLLRLNLRKNRYGQKEKDVLLNWQIDKGYIKPLLDSVGSNQTQGEAEEEYGF